VKDMELAEIDMDYEDEECVKRLHERLSAADSTGLAHASMQPTMTRHHIISYLNASSLYTSAKQALKLKQDNAIEVFEDNNVRTPTFHVSLTMAFPHIYPEKGRKSPSDLFDTNMAEQMMRKPMLFAHEKVYKNCDGNISDREVCWWNAADEVHMMSCYAKIQERKVNAKVGFVLSQHPEAANIPIVNLIETLKNGKNDLPGLSQVMAQLPNSQEHWFAECQGLEAMSRDLGECNWFVTFNTDVRHWHDCRVLIHKLESLSDKDFLHKPVEEWYVCVTKAFMSVS
jgi:hypothetical protein